MLDERRVGERQLELAFADQPSCGEPVRYQTCGLFGVGEHLLIAAVVVVVARAGRNGSPATPTAKELLAQRYARVEIDDDEYFQRLSVLDSTGAPDHSIDRAR